MSARFLILCLIFTLFLGSVGRAQSTPPNTEITNVARATYTHGHIGGLTSESNIVRVITIDIRTLSSLEFLRYAPANPEAYFDAVPATYYSITGNSSGPFEPLDPPLQADGVSEIDLSGPVPLISSTHFTVGEPVFIQLADRDQNADSAISETVLVNLMSARNGDGELLRLTETGHNTGVFMGYIQSGLELASASYNGFVAVREGYELEGNYNDIQDPEDISSDTLIFVSAGTSVFITKTAGKNIVSAGDYVQYNLRIENTTTINLDDINIIDNLPNSTRYQAGSATTDGVSSGDPQISSDGKVLSFRPGVLQPGERRDISYVVEVGPTTRPGKLINEAYAVDPTGIISNIVSATVRVREEIFRSESFLTGRVYVGFCDTSSATQAGQGIAGVRIYLEDGAYAVTDSNGMYHFEGIAPGTHVLQLDKEGLPEMYEADSCEQNSEFAGSPYSKFVDVEGGLVWQADFQVKLKPRETGDVRLGLFSDFHFTTVNYSVNLSGQVVPVKNMRLMAMLPEHLKYVRGSSRISSDSIADPAITGSVLTYELGERSDEWSDTIKFDAMLCSFDTTGELDMECLAIFETPGDGVKKSPVAKNTIKVTAKKDRIQVPPILLSPEFKSFKAELDSAMIRNLDQIAGQYKGLYIKQILVTGHSDNAPINPRSRHIYPDNYALSLARAKVVGEYLQQALGLDPSIFTITGVGPDEPFIGNDLFNSEDLNRRVDIRVISEKTIKYNLLDITRGTDSLAVNITGLRPGETPNIPNAKDKTAENFDKFAQDWLDGAEPGFEWLWPDADYNPPIPSLKVAIKHHPSRTPKLFLDDIEVSPLNFSETTIDPSGSIAVSTWKGIDVHEGSNKFLAVAYDELGEKSALVAREIHYSGPPVNVEVVDSLSSFIADNSRPAVVAVRFTDSDGYPARPGVIGEWSVDPPYTAQQDIDELKANPLLKLQGQKPNYMVGENGIALLEIQTASRSGEALLTFYFVDGEKEVRVWLKPKLREWVLVGLAERTLGYNRTSGNKDNLNNTGVENKTYSSGRGSFFARGSVWRDKLLTLSVDSRRFNANADSGLFRTVDPQSFYSIYGDGMDQGYDVASSRGIFAKIEAANYYGMFGDYNTGLNATELSRYNRTFNGLKFEGGSGRQNLNLFLSRSNQAFIRDEIQGDGTSGPYNLSRDNVVANTERVIVETRDRFQNEIIISSEKMRQFIDYNIDYYTGEIFFKKPISSRDEGLNPIFITIDYEANDLDDWSYNYGGRGGIDVISDKLNVGGTYINEGRIGGYGHLGSLDATYAIGQGFELKTEFAASKVKEGAGRSSGNAYLFELKRSMKKLNGQLYIRDLDSKFGLGQQNLNERGTRKFGAETGYRLREYLTINGQVYRQSYLLTDSRRDFAELKASLTKKRYALQNGIHYAEDRLGNGTANWSSQIMAGGSYKIWADKLELRLLHEQSIIKNDNPDFPTRTTLGADYHISRHLTFFGEQDFATASKEVANDSRLGFKATPWKGAQINSSIQRSYNENAERLFSNLGLVQAWRVNDRLSLDFGLDHGSLIRREGNLSYNPNQTPTSGSPDGFTSISLGASYRQKEWSNAARVEYRDSKTNNKLGITLNSYGEPSQGLGLLLAAKINKNDAAIIKKRDSIIRLGLVSRPRQSRWILLNRLDFIISNQKGGDFGYNNWRLVDNISCNRRFSSHISLALQYGAKYLRETIGAGKYSGYIDLYGTEFRYDINPKWDVGFHFSLLHSWNLRQYQYGSGISTGYTVFKNASASIGYNFAGFDDKDFSEGNFTARGPYLQLRFKFDNATARETAAALGL